MKYLKFILITAFCFLQILCCSVKKPDLGKNKVNIDKNKVEVELIYNFGEVSIVDAKIDNSHLYTTFHNIYNGNISSWGHLCLIDLKNNKNIKRSNVLYNPKRIVEIIDDILFLHCSHDLLPFDKNSISRKPFFIPGDPGILCLNDKRIYFMTSPPAELFCVQRTVPKILWKFDINDKNENYRLLHYAYELNEKVFLIVSELSQSTRATDIYNLNLIILDANSGKELRRQSLSITTTLYNTLENTFISFKNNQMLILSKIRTNMYEIVSYEINTEGIAEKTWQKEFKASSGLFNKIKKDIFIGLHNLCKVIIEDQCIYIPYQEISLDNSSQKIIKKSLLALDRETGKLMWKFDMLDPGRFEYFLKVYNSNGNDKIILTTFAIGKDYYSSSFFFHCLDRKNGKLIWQKKFSNSNYQQIVLKEDRLWGIQEEKKSHSIILNIIDVNTGNVLCSFEPEKIKVYDIYYANNEILPYNRNDAIFVLGDGRVYSIKLIEKQ